MTQPKAYEQDLCLVHRGIRVVSPAPYQSCVGYILYSNDRTWLESWHMCTISFSQVKCCSQDASEIRNGVFGPSTVTCRAAIRLQDHRHGIADSVFKSGPRWAMSYHSCHKLCNTCQTRGCKSCRMSVGHCFNTCEDAYASSCKFTPTEQPPTYYFGFLKRVSRQKLVCFGGSQLQPFTFPCVLR